MHFIYLGLDVIVHFIKTLIQHLFVGLELLRVVIVLLLWFYLTLNLCNKQISIRLLVRRDHDIYSLL